LLSVDTIKTKYDFNGSRPGLSIIGQQILQESLLEQTTLDMRLEDVTTEKMRMVGFWDVILCSLLGSLSLVDKILFFGANKKEVR
jgi:hypothetical protein